MTAIIDPPPDSSTAASCFFRTKWLHMTTACVLLDCSSNLTYGTQLPQMGTTALLPCTSALLPALHSASQKPQLAALLMQGKPITRRAASCSPLLVASAIQASKAGQSRGGWVKMTAAPAATWAGGHRHILNNTVHGWYLISACQSSCVPRYSGVSTVVHYRPCSRVARQHMSFHELHEPHHACMLCTSHGCAVLTSAQGKHTGSPHTQPPWAQYPLAVLQPCGLCCRHCCLANTLQHSLRQLSWSAQDVQCAAACPATLGQ